MYAVRFFRPWLASGLSPFLMRSRLPLARRVTTRRVGVLANVPATTGDQVEPPSFEKDSIAPLFVRIQLRMEPSFISTMLCSSKVCPSSGATVAPPRRVNVRPPSSETSSPALPFVHQMDTGKNHSPFGPRIGLHIITPVPIGRGAGYGAHGSFEASSVSIIRRSLDARARSSCPARWP